MPLLNLAGDADNAMKMKMDAKTGQRYWQSHLTEETYLPKPRELESMHRGDEADHAWLLRDKEQRFGELLLAHLLHSFNQSASKQSGKWPDWRLPTEIRSSVCLFVFCLPVYLGLAIYHALSD